MKATYDCKAYILYIKLKNAKNTNTCMLNDDAYADINETRTLRA